MTGEARGGGWLLGAGVALSSAGSMALEIVAGRMLAPYVGMSLYSWTAVIAVVLAGLSIGHWIGGLRADAARRPGMEAAFWLALSAIGAGLSLLLLTSLGPSAARTLGPIPAILALTSALFFLPSLTVGVVSPILTSMAVAEAGPERAGRTLGTMYALNAAGAILGTLAAGFLLISWIGSARSVIAIAALYLILAAALAARAGAPRSAIATAAAALILLLAAGPGARALGVARLGPPCLVESAYYCIQVDELGEAAPGLTARPGRVLALDHLAHGINDQDDPTYLHSPYLHLVDTLVARRIMAERGAEGRLDAFFAGAGAYTLPRAWLARYPGAQIAAAEIDPRLAEIARERLWLQDDPRLENLAVDARWALAHLPEERRFDVIFGDAFHDVAIPQHLVTDEFHALVKARLKPGGIYVLNVIEALREPPFLLSLAKTLQARFETVELWLSADDVSPQEKRTTWVMVASDRTAPAPKELFADTSPPRLWVRPPTEAMMQVVPAERLVFLTDDHTPVDRLMSHVLLDRRLAE